MQFINFLENPPHVLPEKHLYCSPTGKTQVTTDSRSIITDRQREAQTGITARMNTASFTYTGGRRHKIPGRPIKFYKTWLVDLSLSTVGAEYSIILEQKSLSNERDAALPADKAFTVPVTVFKRHKRRTSETYTHQ